jgi:ABC-type dipeptide/oligopeptide/nickel transport system ATPase component
MEQSPADQFFSQPAHPYGKTLLSFARGQTPAGWTGEKWYLERSRNAAGSATACVFAGFCPDKMPVCETIEPAWRYIQHKNQHAPGPHCVKCHLYDEANTNDF